MPRADPKNDKQARWEWPPARAGRVALTLRIEPELHRKLRTKAFLEDRTIHDMGLLSGTKPLPLVFPTHSSQGLPSF